MKIASMIARVLLGLCFFAFGLMPFLHFIPMPPLPPGPAGVFMGVLFSTGYIYAIKSVEVIGGLLLLTGRFVPLGLTLLAPVIVNILLYDLLLDHTALAPGIVVLILEILLLVRHRAAFAGLLSAKS